MAMFHFRLKSDKKPNGTSISAVQHVDYIQREGRFKNIDQIQDNNTFVGNFISSTEIKDALAVVMLSSTKLTTSALSEILLKALKSLKMLLRLLYPSLLCSVQ